MHSGLFSLHHSLCSFGFQVALELAVVVADDVACSTIGTDILKKGGSGVDAAIAALLCQGVVHLHTSGIGG